MLKKIILGVWWCLVAGVAFRGQIAIGGEWLIFMMYLAFSFSSSKEVS